MEFYHYIHESPETGNLIFTTSPKKLIISETHVELDKKDIEKYRLHIKYINCCFFDENESLSYNYIKVLAQKLNNLNAVVDYNIKKLRELIVEAIGLEKQECAKEIAESIKSLSDFIHDDFSGIKDIQEIDTLTCPELNIDFIKHYASKIYGI
mgnify:FL=1|tara:strand:+ start:456 stop:914 length:459 start_codon:yes stop_codon:yes gene_type:complete